MPIPLWPAYSDDTGTGEDGTFADAALLDAIQTAIEAAVTGPSSIESAATIIDEVVAARGSRASLDDRLSESLTDTGLIDEFNSDNYATALKAGLVSITTQEFEGTKRFLRQPRSGHGSSPSADAAVSGRINSQINTVGNSGVALTTLHTHALGTNALDDDGKTVRLTSWGRLANNGNTKIISLVVGGVTAISLTTVEADRYYRLTAEVIRASATTGNISVRVEIAPTTDNPVTDDRIQNTLAAAIVWTNNITIATQGQSSAASNDIQEDAFILEMVG